MSNNKENISNVGTLILSEEVVAAITYNAVKDIEGVAGFVQRGPDVQSILKSGDSALKSIKVRMSESEITLKIYISLEEGYKIQKVAAEVQKAAKNTVQSMTGKVVGKVDVTVGDIAMKSNKEE